MQDLAGKVAVVTGAASGIGRALVDRFAAEGMSVVMADVERDALDGAAHAVAGAHGADRVLAVPTDVRDEAAVEALAAATFDRFGTAHVVCNNAGVGVGGLAWTVPADRWRWIVEVNLLSVAHGVRAFVPRMIEQGEGHVVNTASAAGLLTGPAMSPYYATKHGVVALSEALYFDLHLVGAPVGVSVLCPEWVRTNIADSERNRPDGVAEMVLPGTPDTAEAPEGRGTPDAVADPDGTGATDGAEATPAPTMGDFVRTLVEGGLDPEDVAGMVLDGIRSGRFWITTHPTTIDSARKRWDAIASDGTPALWEITPG